MKFRLLQSRRESVIHAQADGDRGTKMGEVIQGPWRRSQSVDFMRVLKEEIARMTHALEDLRELHQRRAVVEGDELPATGDSRVE